MAENITKWSYMVKRHEDLEMQIHDLQVKLEASARNMAYLNKTALNVPCSYCGTILATEGDFARHFVIRDTQYLNLGHCPRETDNTDEAQEITRYMAEAKRNAAR